MDVVSLKPFGWLICLIPLGVALRYSLVDRSRHYRFAALGLRIAAIVLLILAVCRPFMAFASDDVHIAFILDVSESVDLKSARDAVDQIDLLNIEFKSILMDSHHHIIGLCRAANQATMSDLLNTVLLRASYSVYFSTNVQIDIILHHGLPECRVTPFNGQHAR